jgi:hypothetical protein
MGNKKVFVIEWNYYFAEDLMPLSKQIHIDFEE